MFLNNHHYNPTLGTFTRVDPLVAATGQPYIYGAANPVRFSDPNGLEPCPQTGCVSDNSGGRLPCGRSTYGTADCKLGNGPPDKKGNPTTTFGPNDSHNRAITESRERKRNHSKDLWDQVDQQGLDFLVGVGGFLPWIGEGIDANDCRNGRTSGCVGVIFPFVGGRFLGEVFGGAARQGALPGARQVDAAWGPAHSYRHGTGPMTAIEHINYRHSYNSGFDDVSRFSQATSARQITDYVDDALRYGNVTQNGASITYDVGRTIGVDQAGNAVTGIQVRVRDGYVRTAYPVVAS